MLVVNVNDRLLLEIIIMQIANTHADNKNFTSYNYINGLVL